MNAPVRSPDQHRPPVVAPDVLPLQPLGSSARSLAGYAALSVGVLVGYFALALGVVVLLAFLTVQALTTTGGGFLGSKLAIFTFVVGLAVARALSAVERTGPEQERGIPAGRSDQPELWALVDDMSRELALPAPDNIRLVEDVSAGVHQDTRLLGLVGGKRHLALGLGLLQVLTVDELRAVLAHELGHYARGETRVDALVHRAGATIERTAEQLGRRSVLGRLFVRYSQLFQRVSLAVRRRQELGADAAAVRLGGRAAHESALRQVRTGAVAWGFFWDRYVVPVWQAGAAPVDLYSGFRCLLADPVRTEQLEAVRCDDGGPADPYDSHPRLAARLAAARRLPDRPARGDARPARALLLDGAAVERRVSDDVSSRVLQQVPEDLYAFGADLDPTPYVAPVDAEVAALSRATAEVDGCGGPAGLGRTLTLLEQHRGPELVTALTGDRRDHSGPGWASTLHELVLGSVALSAAGALVQAGRAAWHADWSGPAHLRDADGSRVDLRLSLERSLEESGVAGLRGALLAAGVPLEDGAIGTPDGLVLPEEQNDVLMVWPGLAGRRARFDGYVTRDRLVLVRQPRTWRDDWCRALGEVYGLGRRRLEQAAAERVQAVLREPLSEVCRRPATHVVRWDDLPSVALKSSIDKAWVLRLGRQQPPFHRLKAEDDKLSPGSRQTAALLRQLVGDRLDSKH
jgi:Zn-dependent protease with chaperone function